MPLESLRQETLAQALAEDREQLAELTALYAATNITAREWSEARNPIQARINEAEQALRATRSDALAGLAGNASGYALRGSD